MTGKGRRHVVVAGSINVDVVVSTERHPRPGETVTGTGLRRFPGGKGANQAVASARAGAAVRMLGAVGDDPAGTDAVRFLDSAGVDVHLVRTREGLPTGTALIVVAANGENTIVVAAGANATLDEETVVIPDATAGDVFVTQYETPRPAAVAFLRHGRAVGATCIVNPAPAAATPRQILELVDILVLNQTELAVLCGVTLAAEASETDIFDAIGKLRTNGSTGCVVTTLGSRGILAVVEDRAIRIPGHPVVAVDTTGAGDCFVGSLAAELAQGSDLVLALEFANAAAALCVTRPGAGPSMPTRAQVDTFRAHSS